MYTRWFNTPFGWCLVLTLAEWNLFLLSVTKHNVKCYGYNFVFAWLWQINQTQSTKHDVKYHVRLNITLCLLDCDRSIKHSQPNTMFLYYLDQINRTQSSSYVNTVMDARQTDTPNLSFPILATPTDWPHPLTTPTCHTHWPHPLTVRRRCSLKSPSSRAWHPVGSSDPDWRVVDWDGALHSRDRWTQTVQSTQ